MTEGARRDRAGYLATLVVTRWVLVRRPSVSLPGPPSSDCVGPPSSDWLPWSPGLHCGLA